MRWLLLFLLLSSRLAAQDWNPIGKSIGLYIGYSFVDESLRDQQRYHPLLIMVQYHLPINRNKKLAMYIEPQFNLATLSRTNVRYDEWEAGVNLGLRYHVPVGERGAAWAGIAAGPHWLTAETGQQASGFIFSDNFSAGYTHQVAQQWNWSGQLRFRHLSNAGFKEPNIGLDNWFVITGISRLMP